jgi:hypothetical protein
VAANQRHLNAKVSPNANIAVKVENDWQESVRKLAQAHDVSIKIVHASFYTDL